MINSIQNIFLNPNELQVWYAEIDTNLVNLNKFQQAFSTDELKRASKFKFDKDRNCFIVSRGILRFLLGKYLRQRPEDIHFMYSEFGKPYVKSNLQFNISHSGNRVVLAFTKDVEVGIDIERIKTDFDVLPMAKSVFSKQEIFALNKASFKDLHRSFYRCWTRKEAFVKNLGSGLSFPLKQFTVSFDSDSEATLIKTDWDNTEKDNWSLSSFTFEDDYIGCAAVRSHLVFVNYYNFDNFESCK